jgi:hypothetical protein
VPFIVIAYDPTSDSEVDTIVNVGDEVDKVIKLGTVPPDVSVCE